MKIGPIAVGDCLPFNLDVDEKWLAEQMAEYPGKDPAAIIADYFIAELAKDLDRHAEAVMAYIADQQGAAHE